MTTRFRVLTVLMLISLLATLATPVVALAQGPRAEGPMATPMHRGGGHHGPGHGGHHGGGWGQNAMLDTFATALGMTPQTLVEYIRSGHTIATLVPDEAGREALIDAVVDQLMRWTETCVGAGHMDEAQQAWMEEHLRAHVDWLIDNSEVLLYEWQHGPSHGAGWGHDFGGLIWATAEVLDLTPWEIRVALSQGQTIAELAGNDPGTIDQIVAVFMAPRIEALNAAVAASQLTQEQADWLRAEMEEHVRWLIQNGTWGWPGHGRGHR